MLPLHPRLINRTGVYSEAASIRGNTVCPFVARVCSGSISLHVFVVVVNRVQPNEPNGVNTLLQVYNYCVLYFLFDFVTFTLVFINVFEHKINVYYCEICIIGESHYCRIIAS